MVGRTIHYPSGLACLQLMQNVSRVKSRLLLAVPWHYSKVSRLVAAAPCYSVPDLPAWVVKAWQYSAVLQD